MNKNDNKNLHERAVSQVKNLNENNLEDVTQNDDYVNVISKLTIERMLHDLFNITDCTRKTLYEFQLRAESDVNKSLIELIRRHNNLLVNINTRLANDYSEIYESEMN